MDLVVIAQTNLLPEVVSVIEMMIRIPSFSLASREAMVVVEVLARMDAVVLVDIGAVVDMVAVVVVIMLVVVDFRPLTTRRKLSMKRLKPNSPRLTLQKSSGPRLALIAKRRDISSVTVQSPSLMSDVSCMLLLMCQQHLLKILHIPYTLQQIMLREQKKQLLQYLMDRVK